MNPRATTSSDAKTKDVGSYLRAAFAGVPVQPLPEEFELLLKQLDELLPSCRDGPVGEASGPELVGG